MLLHGSGRKAADLSFWLRDWLSDHADWLLSHAHGPHASLGLPSLSISNRWHLWWRRLLDGILIGAQNDGTSRWNVNVELAWSTVGLLVVSLIPSIVSVIESLMSTKSLLIRFINDEMV